jgi:hypothetical protein
MVEETPAPPAEEKAPDVGQPVGHIVSNLVDCDRLVADVSRAGQLGSLSGRDAGP